MTLPAFVPSRNAHEFHCAVGEPMCYKLSRERRDYGGNGRYRYYLIGYREEIIWTNRRATIGFITANSDVEAIQKARQMIYDQQLATYRSGPSANLT